MMAQGKSEDEAKKLAPSILEAQEMLRKWEAGDEEVVALWKKNEPNGCTMVLSKPIKT